MSQTNWMSQTCLKHWLVILKELSNTIKTIVIPKGQISRWTSFVIRWLILKSVLPLHVMRQLITCYWRLQGRNVSTSSTVKCLETCVLPTGTALLLKEVVVWFIINILNFPGACICSLVLSKTFILGRQWTYQTCTEFGYYQSSDLADQPFGKRFPIEFSIRQCSDIFGPKFSYNLLKNAIARTNFIYGGLGLKLDRTVFPNGSVDPWSALGITSNTTGNVAIFIQGNHEDLNYKISRFIFLPNFMVDCTMHIFVSIYRHRPLCWYVSAVT